MSKDAQISHACPHYLRFERVSAAGGREILTESPISGSGLLDLRRDGISLPPSGLNRPAEVVFPTSAPYRVREGDNTLTVLSGGVSGNISIPSGIYTASKLVALLNKSLPAPLRAEEYFTSVKITDDGRDYPFTLSGTALSRLGFTSTTMRVRGRKLTPPWRLSKIVGGEGYRVLLDSPINPEGLLDISYTTTKPLCRRCGGTGVENDLRFSVVGDIAFIEDHNLLYQSVAKILLTVKGSNPFHNWYGSTASGFVGQKSNAGIRQAIKDSVRDALDRFQRAQQVQAGVQQLSLKEQLRRVLSVEVTEIDPTAYLCSVSVQSASSESVSVTIVFATPGALPLDGDLS